TVIVVYSGIYVVIHCYHFLSFSFNHAPPTHLYTLSLHDALPICRSRTARVFKNVIAGCCVVFRNASTHLPSSFSSLARSAAAEQDRKSTRLNSSHLVISYAVFCLKKKKIESITPIDLNRQ